MIGRKAHFLERDALGRRRLNMWSRIVAVAALSLAGLALTVPVASASTSPVVTTEAASAVSYERATLSGTINPGGLVTTYHFEYGETTSYGTKVPTPDVYAGEGTSNVKVSQVIRGLKVGPTYHFRLVATNTMGTTYGEDRTFTTASWGINSQELESSVAVTSKGTLKVNHTLPPLLGGGKVTIECAVAGEGTLGVGGAGEVTHGKLTGCKVLSSTTTICTTGTTPTGGAGDLPWRTQLVSSEGAMREQISEDGKGVPGFELECKTLKIGGFANTSMAVKAVAGGVDETYDSHSAELKFTDSGTGTFEGTQLIENPSSGTLTVGPALGEWLVGGKVAEKAVTVASKGTLVIQLGFRPLEGGGSMAVQCTYAGEGTIGPDSEGEVTGIKLTGCSAFDSIVSGCADGETVHVGALHLPWRTLLVTNEGATRELFSEDGNSAPRYQVECKEHLSIGTGKTSMAVKTVTGGVEQTFDSHSEELIWSGAASGLLEGSQLIESPSSGTLTFKAA